MERVNAQFLTNYTFETFQGTNWYKFLYTSAQRLQENEVKTAEIFLKLQGYIDYVNDIISRPVVTNPGMVEKFMAEGFVASLKPMIEIDAGKSHICVDVDSGTHAEGEVEITDFASLISGTPDSIQVGSVTFTAQAGAATPNTATFQANASNDSTAESLAIQINSHDDTKDIVRARVIDNVVYLRSKEPGTAGNSTALVYTDNDTNVGATVTGSGTLEDGVDNEDYQEIKEEICDLISKVVVAGVVTVGLETETIVLSNGQSFDFSFNLPNRLHVLLRLTLTLSENNQLVIGDPDETKQKLLNQIMQRYRLGLNFEPQKYFTVEDAPWCSQILLEYSLDEGATWESDIYDAPYDDLFVFGLEDITLVEE